MIHGKEEIEALRAQHNPDLQEDNPTGRCAHCHYTRHPCDVHDLCTDWLEMQALIDELQEKIAYVRQGCVRMTREELIQRLTEVGSEAWKAGHWIALRESLSAQRGYEHGYADGLGRLHEPRNEEDET